MAEATEAAEARGRDRISVRKGERVRVEAQIGRGNFLTIIMSIGEGGGGEGLCTAVAEWQTMERQAANFAKLPILLPGNEPTTEGGKEGRKEGRKEQDERRGGFGGIGRTRQLSNS